MGDHQHQISLAMPCGPAFRHGWAPVPAQGHRRPSTSPSGLAGLPASAPRCADRSEEHTSELQSQSNLVCRLLLEKKKTQTLDIKSAVRSGELVKILGTGEVTVPLQVTPHAFSASARSRITSSGERINKHWFPRA